MSNECNSPDSILELLRLKLSLVSVEFGRFCWVLNDPWACANAMAMRATSADRDMCLWATVLWRRALVQTDLLVRLVLQRHHNIKFNLMQRERASVAELAEQA